VFYGEDFCLPMTHETEDFDSLGTNTVVTSMDTPLSSDNIGFRLVAKMGWQTGTGLGSRQQGNHTLCHGVWQPLSSIII